MIKQITVALKITAIEKLLSTNDYILPDYRLLTADYPVSSFISLSN